MSSYFKDFPQYLYDFNYGNKTKTSVVVDITRNIRFKREVLSNIALYDEYDIVDGETPEIIAEKFYGTPEYHWVIMMANEKYDYRNDFPLPDPVLIKHIQEAYNPILHSREWRIEDQKIIFKVYDSYEVFDVNYMIYPVEFTMQFETTNGKFTMTHNWDNSHLNDHGFDNITQEFFQKLDDATGTILASQANAIVHGTNTNFQSLFVGSTLYISTGEEIGVIESIQSNNLLTLKEKSKVNVDHKQWTWVMGGTPVGEITITTKGREYNPVYFVNTLGETINPSPTAIPVTGDYIHRLENDQKRKIKIISPSLLEVIIRNYEEEL